MKVPRKRQSMGTSRQIKFVKILKKGACLKQAALMAGYSETTKPTDILKSLTECYYGEIVTSGITTDTLAEKLASLLDAADKDGRPLYGVDKTGAIIMRFLGLL